MGDARSRLRGGLGHLIGVLRAYAIARHKALNATLAADDSTPLQVIGAFLLWVLRLVMDQCRLA
jgi:hypothetical protein